MSYTVEQLLILATEFDKLATDSLKKSAAPPVKDNKKDSKKPEKG